VTISQAALGGKKKIETIWGPKEIDIPSGAQDGAQITLAGSGIETTFGKGDHIVVTRILIPKKLT
jgi:molecular chaperone DnaJ